MPATVRSRYGQRPAAERIVAADEGAQLPDGIHSSNLAPSHLNSGVRRATRFTGVKKAVPQIEIGAPASRIEVLANLSGRPGTTISKPVLGLGGHRPLSGWAVVGLSSSAVQRGPTAAGGGERGGRLAARAGRNYRETLRESAGRHVGTGFGTRMESHHA